MKVLNILESEENNWELGELRGNYMMPHAVRQVP